MSTSNNFIICITCFIIRFNYYLNSLFIHYLRLNRGVEGLDVLFIIYNKFIFLVFMAKIFYTFTIMHTNI